MNYQTQLGKIEIRSARNKYNDQRLGAKKRSIEWEITFDEWINWWLATGKWSERGCKKGQYVMSRYNDVGPYNLTNIYCNTASQNSSDSTRGKQVPRKKPSRDIRSWNKRPIKTPYGTFSSVTDAARHINKHVTTLYWHIKKYPEQYKYLD